MCLNKQGPKELKVGFGLLLEKLSSKNLGARGEKENGPLSSID